MQVLSVLCARSGEVVSTEELLRLCWGSTVYGDGPVHKAITQLRKALGDQPTEARYIQTIRKRGYRAVAHVTNPDGIRSRREPVEWRDGSPFRGLEPFDRRHAGVFYGRAQAGAGLLACLRAQTAQGCAMVLLLGPSGSGKTSLVQAGVLPTLMGEGEIAAGAMNAGAMNAIEQEDPIALAAVANLDVANLDSTRLDDHGPWRLLAEAMLDWRIGTRAVLPPQSVEVLAQRLAQSFDLVQAELRWQLDGLLGGARKQAALGLFVDQLEKLFLATTLDPAAQDAFIAALHALASGGDVLVILACRNDLYPRLARQPLLMALKTRGGHYDLPAPSHAEISQMIRIPAHAAGLSFGIDRDSQTHLDDALCAAAAASPDALPLLQYALHLLYEARSTSNELDFAAYRRIGGIEGAISYRAETLLSGMGEREQASLPRVLALLVSLSEDEGVVVGRRALWSALRSEAERNLVRALVDARLLVSELVAGAPGFGVAHEALLRRWPRAIVWIEQHRSLLRAHARLSTLATRWQEAQRSHDLLLPDGRQLEEARQLLTDEVIVLAPVERALIDASTARATRRRRLRGAALASIGALALLVGVLGLLAIRADRAAQARRVQAEGLMSYMLGDFADKLRPLGRLDLLEGISAKAFAYLADTRGERLDPAEQKQRAQALQVIAEVQISRGAPEQADKALDAARTLLLRRLDEFPNDTDALKLLGVNAFWLGSIRLDRSELAQAQGHFDEYLRASRRRHALRPDDVDAWIEESYALNSLGTLSLKRGDLQRAADAFARSVDLKLRALQRQPQDATLKADLADSISWEATTQQRAGQLQAALAAYAREAAIITRLQGNPPVEALWRHRLAYAFVHSAELRLALGQHERAAKELRQALHELEDIVAAQPDNLDWASDLLYARLLWEDLASAMARTRSLAASQALIAQSQALTAHDPDNEPWRRLRANAGVQLALALAERGDRDRARTQIATSVQDLQSIYRRDPDSQASIQALAEAWLASARITNGDAAREDCRRAAELLRGTANQSRDYRILSPWRRSQACLGNHAEEAAATTRLARIGYREWRAPEITKHKGSQHE